MRKKVLITTFCFVLSFGVILTSKLFVGYLNPSAEARNKNTKFVDLGVLPEDGFYETEYQFYKVFIAKHPLRAYRIPTHYREGYGLPDPTWHRPFIPCQTFVFEDGWFQCKDFDQSHYYSELAKWDKFGKTIEGSWMPNLEPIAFETSHRVIAFDSKMQ